MRQTWRAPLAAATPTLPGSPRRTPGPPAAAAPVPLKTVSSPTARRRGVLEGHPCTSCFLQRRARFTPLSFLHCYYWFAKQEPDLKFERDTTVSLEQRPERPIQGLPQPRSCAASDLGNTVGTGCHNAQGLFTMTIDSAPRTSTGRTQAMSCRTRRRVAALTPRNTSGQ